MQRASQEDLGKCLSSLMRTGPSPMTSAGGKASKTWAPSSCAWDLKMDLAAAHDCLDASQRGSREAWGAPVSSRCTMFYISSSLRSRSKIQVTACSEPGETD
ncbi:Dna Dc-_Du-Editing Enzyme Apobec-3H [Manis pentadactyla]|nr:Dna Dc->Du-Editing Enzyme Apobec-3H [Manis pentadactyla]